MKKRFILFLVLILVFSSIITAEDSVTKQSTPTTKFTLNLDDLSRNLVKHNTNSSLDIISNFLTTYDYYFLFATPVVGYTVGYLTDDYRLKKVSEDAIISSAISGGIALLTKIVAGRERPYAEEGSLSFNPFASITQGATYTSFPSGHSTIAWSVYTPYAKEYGWWIYIIPTSISFSRIYEDVHWLSDVVTGSFLGYYTASYVYYF
ncbi:phosphatase PAP2 family protein [Petrotoga sp. SL27]|uniref:phosphatase PAP2 family protein n=1 Tax=Petrotoga sp. SL27 TaxID=1445612 RepID=UPI000CDED255|nr:phosphatase PAP2 family protein [Petrotoga sp. SL27]